MALRPGLAPGLLLSGGRANHSTHLRPSNQTKGSSTRRVGNFGKIGGHKPYFDRGLSLQRGFLSK